MELHALKPRHKTSIADYAIRIEFCKTLAALPGPAITLDPTSQGAPSLSFKFITEFVFQRSIERAEIVEGCGNTRRDGLMCNPHMGQEVGCEYSRICDCLEYAPVNTARLTPAQQELFERGETLGIPKRFPYGAPGRHNEFCLVGFYLDRRDTIYECNRLCKCGPNCKTRVVQKGRQVPLEIFDTGNRGWGNIHSSPTFPWYICA